LGTSFAKQKKVCQKKESVPFEEVKVESTSNKRTKESVPNIRKWHLKEVKVESTSFNYWLMDHTGMKNQ